jgi:hypothetical protein
VTSNGESYARQSPVTDPGEGSSWYDGLPTDLAALTAVVRNLVVHQDRVPPGSVDAARLAREPRVRDVATMVATLRDLDARPATERRAPQNRIVGHCRTSSVLLTSFLRHQGVPARPRCGFSVYYAGGREFYGDHWVTEYGDRPSGRWRLADAELDEPTCRQHGIGFDPLDVPRDQLLLAGRAWQDGRTDSDRWRWYGSHPGDTGRAYVAGQLLRDVACLRRDEPGAFDSWAPDPLPPHLEDLDLLAARTLEPDPQLPDLEPALLR